MKTFFSNTFVHWFIVTLVGALNQWITGNAAGSLTLSAGVHALYEWLLLKYPA